MNWNFKKKKIKIYLLWSAFLIGLSFGDQEQFYYSKIDSGFKAGLDLDPKGFYELIAFDGKKAQVFRLDLGESKDGLEPGSYLLLKVRGSKLKSFEKISGQELPRKIKDTLDGRIR